MDMDIRIEGLVELRSELEKVGFSIDKAIDKALTLAANEVLELSNEYVPVVTGTLRDSGKIEIKVRQDDANATIKYTAPYATSVHERTESKGSKFLERAINESHDQFRESFIEHLKEVLGG